MFPKAEPIDRKDLFWTVLLLVSMILFCGAGGLITTAVLTNGREAAGSVNPFDAVVILFAVLFVFWPSIVRNGIRSYIVLWSLLSFFSGVAASFLDYAIRS